MDKDFFSLYVLLGTNASSAIFLDTSMELVLEGEREAELVGVLVEAGGVDGGTKVDLDTGTEGLGVTGREKSKA